MRLSRALIVGCGYVGTQLGLELARSGVHVWGLRRTAGSLPAPIAPIAADLLARDGLARALPDALDAVVYATAASAYDEAGYRAAYVDGVRNLIEALEGRGLRPARFVFCSSTGVYGQSGGEWVDEGSPTEPGRATARAILEGERLVLASHFSGCALRFSGIYGPGRSRLVDQVRSGAARRHGDPPRWTNRIHRDDCAGAIAWVLGLERPEPVYLVSDGEPAPHDEVLAWIAERIGVAPPPFAPEPPDGRISGQNKRCSSARLRASGYVLRYPSYREGYEALIGE